MRLIETKFDEEFNKNSTWINEPSIFIWHDRCLQTIITSALVGWISIWHKLWNFLRFSKVANTASDRLPLWLIHELKSDRSLRYNLSCNLLDHKIKELLILRVKRILRFLLICFLLLSILADKQFLSFFTIVGKQ